MRRIALAWVLALLLGALGLSAASAQVLIVDQTLNLMESMQVEILARALLGSGLFSIKAVTKIPDAPHPAGSFDFVVVIPPSREWVWVCAPGLPAVLPEGQQRALAVLKTSIEQVFAGEREPADPADDLYPLIWSAYFLSIGILEGVY